MRRFTLLSLLILGTLWATQCQAELTLSPPARALTEDEKKSIKECEITPETKLQPATMRKFSGTGKGRLILGGGGFTTAPYSDPFVERINKEQAGKEKRDSVALILSASTRTQKKLVEVPLTEDEKKKAMEEAKDEQPKLTKRVLVEFDATQQVVGSWAKWQQKIPSADVVPVFTTRGDKFGSVEFADPAKRPGFADDQKKSPVYSEKLAQDTGNGKATFSIEMKAPGEPVPWPKDRKSSYEVSEDPNDEANAKAVRDAKYIIVEGGYGGGLSHLVGTKTGDAIKEALAQGKTVYASSEGTNAVGGQKHAGYLWPVRQIGNWEKQVGRSETGPALFAGVSATEDFFTVSSHVNSDRLHVALSGHGESTQLVDTADKKTWDYKTSNPYTYLDPLRQLYTGANAGKLDTPSFGIPDEASLVYEGKVATFKSSRPGDRLYVFDPRYPLDGECHYWWVPPGTRINVETGRVLPPRKRQAGQKPSAPDSRTHRE